jgi:hypothetical protein
MIINDTSKEIDGTSLKINKDIATPIKGAIA